MKLTADNSSTEVESAFVHDDALVARIDGREQRWPLEQRADGSCRVRIGDAWVAFTVRKKGADVWVQAGPDALRFVASAEAGSDRAAETVVRSAMPGKIIAVKVSAGDAVAAGDTLVVVEAMKMELPLTAPRAARVASVLKTQGSRVEAGEPIVLLEK